MSRVDVVLLGCILPFALRGLWRGFAREAVALAALATATVLAIRHGRDLGRSLELRTGLDPEAALLLAAAGTFLAVIVAGAIVGRIARGAVRAVFLGPVDRIAGGLLGMAQGAALVGLACLGAQRLAPGSTAAMAVEHSRVGRHLVILADRLIEAVRPLAPLALGGAA